MPFLSLPNEIIFQISNYLDLHEYYSLLRCSHCLAGLLLPTLSNFTLVYPDTRGQRALQLAAERGDIAAIKSLIDLGVTAAMAKGNHIYHICPSLAPIAINTLLATGHFSINACDSSRRTPLYYAAADNPVAVECLMSLGADGNLEDDNYETPLIIATQHNSSDIIRLLLTDARIDINGKDFEGRMALYWAAQIGYVEATAALLEDGRIDVNFRGWLIFFTSFNVSALEVARALGHDDVVQMLLARPDIES
ncbi:ankyrin [Choiromyces venosus 120613-1]|uniref:Ankyrin n=1 Tax=Choiromyces venosus 120613-1 TaxID=1336337 RepID=A0A3N4JAE8_9PEZI|nr:ankyrin [Choiromyces venosus 120613-1]